MEGISKETKQQIDSVVGDGGVEVKAIESIDMDSLRWTGLDYFAKVSAKASTTSKAFAIWEKLIDMEDPGATHVAALQAVQGTGGVPPDETPDQYESGIPTETAPGLEQSLFLLALMTSSLLRQRHSRRIVSLVSDVRVAVDQLHDRLGDMDDGELDPDSRDKDGDLQRAARTRICHAISILIQCAAAGCSVLFPEGKRTGSSPQELAAGRAADAANLLRDGSKYLIDTVTQRCLGVSPSTTGTSEQGLGADGAPAQPNGARSQAKLRHAVAVLCMAVGGFLCHACIREDLLAVTNLGIDADGPASASNPGLSGGTGERASSGAREAAAGEKVYEKESASDDASIRPVVLALYQAWLHCCVACGLGTHSSACLAPPSGAGSIAEVLKDLPGSFALEAPYIRAREATRHQSTATRRGTGLLACSALASTGARMEVSSLAKIRPGHIRLAMWCCRPSATTTAEAVAGTGFWTGVSPPSAVGYQWLPLALCLLQESGELSQAGIAATARWSLAAPQESVQPAVLAVAKASAMQTAERRAAAQGTGADPDADVLDEELVPESLVLRALLLAATSGGPSDGSAVKGLAMATAECFLDAIAPRPRLFILRSAMQRCPFTAGTAALVGVTTRSIARDWNRVADAVQAAAGAQAPPESAVGGSSPPPSSSSGTGNEQVIDAAREAALRKYPFAGPEGTFLVDDMANARVNCLSQEVKGMFQQLQSAMRRSRGQGGAHGGVGGGGEPGGEEELETPQGTARHAAALADQMPVHAACMQSWRLTAGLQRRRPIPGLDPTSAMRTDDFQGGYLNSLRRDVLATINAGVKHGIVQAPAPASRSEPLMSASGLAASTGAGSASREPVPLVTTDKASTLIATEATSGQHEHSAGDGTVPQAAGGTPRPVGSGMTHRQEFADLLLLKHSIQDFLESLTAL